MAESSKRAKARALLARSGYGKTGGHFSKGDERADAAMVAKGVHEHEGALHRGEPKTKLKLKDGGYAHGGDVRPRGDRKPRHSGKKGKPHVVVNVMAGGQHPQPVPVPVPKPVPMPAGGPAMPPMGAGPMPPGPMGAPPGAGPMPPPGMKKGGKVPSGRDPIKGLPEGKLAKGGRAASAQKLLAKAGYDGGAGGGLGRLEKIKAYGA